MTAVCIHAKQTNVGGREECMHINLTNDEEAEFIVLSWVENVQFNFVGPYFHLSEY